MPRMAAIILVVVLLVPAAAHAVLDEPGFRDVGVAHASAPISALALAPDGRLFAAVQTTDQSTGTPPLPVAAQIRVYQAYATNDGSVLDEGTLWATVDGVRATTLQEGLLGLALAPDFATSKLVYVVVTAADQSQSELRVYRENASGSGDYLGVVATSSAPASASSQRNGGGLAFGADACLYAGLGDDGASWNAQLPLGTDPIGGTEQASLCTNVCLGPAELPGRTVKNDGNPNEAGKVLRLAVDGAAPAQPGLFAAGFRNPSPSPCTPSPASSSSPSAGTTSSRRSTSSTRARTAVGPASRARRSAPPASAVLRAGSRATSTRTTPPGGGRS